MQHNDDLQPRIHKWLANQGYPLEMRFAERVRTLTKLNVRQGWHFEDPEEGVSREIDIVCTALEPHGFAEINFVVECKGTSKPWVIFSSEDAVAGYHRLAAFGILSREAFSEVATRALDRPEAYVPTESIPWLWKEGRVGYSIAQAFDGGNAPYVGSLSALKASLWLRENSLWQSTEHRKFVATFPAVLTSSPLFECYLDDAGEVRLAPIEKGFLFFPKKVGGSGGTCLSIVSVAGVDRFVQECDRVAKILLEMLQNGIKREWDLLKANQTQRT